MNRENKRKQYEKGYYKTHPCDESFICRNCGYPVVPAGAGATIGTIAPTACVPCIWTSSRVTGNRTAAD